MAVTTDSERELFCVLRAQSGSHESLDELLGILQEPLFRYVRSLVHDQSQAEDILQEVFFRIYRKLKWLREPRALRPWAYQIASRETFRYLKREGWSRSREVVDQEILESIPFQDTDAGFSKDLINQLPQLVEKLSPASRAVIVLYYLHELSLSETATVLEIPVGTVKSRLAYGLSCLRRGLGESKESK
jgi:RNA polymerase sigma-70 factor (ECF subfamily)